MKNKVLISVVLVSALTIVIGVICLAWSQNNLLSNVVSDSGTTTTTNSVVISTYYIPEMGVRFEYPTYATVTADVQPGTTGEMVVGVVQLKSEERVMFSGLTPDYTKPRGGDITDTRGYFTDGDGVYYTHASDKAASTLPVAYTLETTSGGKAIVITDPEYAGPDGIMAIINTKSTRFPGIAFSGSTKTPESRALFESIVRSVVLE